MNYPQNNKILLVESDEETRSRLCAFLENLGYRVIETDNSKDAIRCALYEIPDLILMDLDLPKGAGLKTISVFRRQNYLRKIPILVSSADGSRGIELFLNIDKFGEGKIEYIPKPVSTDDIEFYLNLLLPAKKKHLKAAAKLSLVFPLPVNY